MVSGGAARTRSAFVGITSSYKPDAGGNSSDSGARAGVLRGGPSRAYSHEAAGLIGGSVAEPPELSGRTTTDGEPMLAPEFVAATATMQGRVPRKPQSSVLSVEPAVAVGRLDRVLLAIVLDDHADRGYALGSRGSPSSRCAIFGRMSTV
jgi:hypothetical protein